MIFRLSQAGGMCDRNRRVKKTRKVFERPDSKALNNVTKILDKTGAPLRRLPVFDVPSPNLSGQGTSTGVLVAKKTRSWNFLASAYGMFSIWKLLLAQNFQLILFLQYSTKKT